MTPRWVEAAAIGCLGCELGGCSLGDGVLGGVGHTGGGSAGATGANASCEIPGPMVTLADRDGLGSYDACTGRIAAGFFLNALCSCGDATFTNSLQTRGFDSGRGPYQPDQADDSGASVGIDGDYVLATGYTDVAGSFSVAGPNRLELVGSLLVRGDFRAAGDVLVAGEATIARNAWLAGSYTGLGPLTVAGELHHAGSVTALPLLALVNTTEAVTVQRPCACEPRDLLDVGQLIDGAQDNNDNAGSGIQPDALASIAGATSVTLSCGRFYLDRIGGTGNLVIQANGPVALFVGGAIDLDGNLTVELAPGAEIDVFVRQDLGVNGQLALGDSSRPAAGRIYVGGTAEIVLTNPFIGNLYAPWARVSSTGSLEMWGSVFCGEFAAGGATGIYDRAILAAGAQCSTPQPPPGSCSRCGWCSGGTACVDGVCGPCRLDEDCCSQSVCANGSCVTLVEVR